MAITTKTAVVFRHVMANISLYDCLWVNTADSEQRDHRTVVRQGVHTAGCHRRHPMQHFERNAGGIGGFNCKSQDLI
jgi:hypothetical protein